MDSIKLDRMADVLLDWSSKVKKGEMVKIGADITAFPMVKALVKGVLERGAVPVYRVQSEELAEIVYTHGTVEQYKGLVESARFDGRHFDAYINILSEENLRSLAGIDDAKLREFTKALSPAKRTHRARVDSGKARGNCTLYPTTGYAQAAGMSNADFEEMTYRSFYAHKKDPVGHWAKLTKEWHKLARWMTKRATFRIEAENTDLTISTKGRKFYISDGIINMPDGEVYTAPVEDSAEGHIEFDYPSFIYGRNVGKVRLTFEKGKCVVGESDSENDLFQRFLDIDKGARYLGELAWGLNTEIKDYTHNFLFDEKIAGTMHLALGFTVNGALGKNRSAIHQDILLDLRRGSRITADGELIIRNGKWLVS